MFMKDRKPADIKGKTVIVVDDGIATGNTMLSIIDTIRRNNPKEIIIAVPVAAPSAIELLSPVVDEIVCVDMPEYFRGVGQFYADFTQTTDEEVIDLLEKARDNTQV
jgi:predicted phosphoribosyltransferase